MAFSNDSVLSSRGFEREEVNVNTLTWPLLGYEYMRKTNNK